MANRNMFRTMVSMQAHDYASAFAASVGKMRLAPADYAPELTAPDGVSTGGGVQALQHIRLVPQKQGFSPLLIGHAHPVDKTAELRSFEYVDLAHQQRFKQPVQLDREQYQQFLQAARNFLEVLQVTVVHAGPPADLYVKPMSVRPPPAPSSSNSGIIALVVGVFFLLLAAAVLIAFFVWRSKMGT